jgi:hypothetical protein
MMRDAGRIANCVPEWAGRAISGERVGNDVTANAKQSDLSIASLQLD